jgi:hypothetical protein
LGSFIPAGQRVGVSVPGAQQVAAPVETAPSGVTVPGGSQQAPVQNMGINEMLMFLQQQQLQQQQQMQLFMQQDREQREVKEQQRELKEQQMQQERIKEREQQLHLQQEIQRERIEFEKEKLRAKGQEREERQAKEQQMQQQQLRREQMLLDQMKADRDQAKIDRDRATEKQERAEQTALNFENRLEKALRLTKGIIPQMPDKVWLLPAYLVDLEKHLDRLKIANDLRPVIVLPLLNSHMKNVFRYAEPEELSDWDKFKAKIRVESHLTPAALRSQFDSCKRMHGETVSQFVNRAASCWSAYLEARRITTFRELSNLIVHDKMLEGVATNVRYILTDKEKDNMPHAYADAARIIDVYETECGVGASRFRQPYRFQGSDKTTDGGDHAQKKTDNFQTPVREEKLTSWGGAAEYKTGPERQENGKFVFQKRNLSNITCHACLKQGHLQKNCPFVGQNTTVKYVRGVRGARHRRGRGRYYGSDRGRYIPTDTKSVETQVK